jgi:hypothetical protein
VRGETLAFAMVLPDCLAGKIWNTVLRTTRSSSYPLRYCFVSFQRRSFAGHIASVADHVRVRWELAKGLGMFAVPGGDGRVPTGGV